METTEVIIARLVLGYLKEEKCRTAYKQFIKTSQHLQTNSVTRTKYLPTRFVGLTLADILCEYFEISKIVQGRLEATNYYNECHSRTSLVQQLLYLLGKCQSSRTSTPCPRSPLESNLDETSPSHIDHVSDVETTPAHTLPGNVRCTSEDSYLYKTPKRKSNSKLSKSTTVADLAEKEDMSEVLAQTLLENKEFHEKIAQTINKVAEKQYRVSSELDRTVKTVVKETEADPIFDKILEEIIGSTSAIENCKEAETSSTTSSTAKDSADELGNKSRRTQTCSTSEHSEDDTKQRIHSTSDTVLQQNEEAVRSIVANSNLKSDFHTSTPEMQVNNEVTVFNGTLDTYLSTNTCNANTQTQPLENPLYINTTGSMLMVPSGVPSDTNSHSKKQYYLLNKQPSTNWMVPPVQTANIITKEDILAMPTIIVSDKEQTKIVSQPVVPAPVSTNSALPTIIPKPVVEIPSEFFDFYTETNHVMQQIGLKKVIYPKKAKNPKTKEKPVEETNPSVIHVVKSIPDNLVEEEEEPADKAINLPETNDKTDREQLTPPPTVEHVQKTPKSGSHVRNLDFSTPPKLTSTHKKTVKKVDDKSSRKSPPIVPKKQVAKSLFNPQDSASTNEDKPAEAIKKPKEWDSDLRANILPPEEEIRPNSPKRKKKTAVTKDKKVKKCKIVKKQLNTTEHEAALIEAALQTPIKSVNEKCDVQTNNDETENTKTDNIDKETNSENNNASNDDPAKLTEDLPDKELTESAVKTVLSPSKLNASKRNLINSDNIDKNTNINSTKTEKEPNKFITPEMAKENVHYPIKANRNITSMFDTPLKDEVIPKTPGAVSPNTSLNTPFSKMLEANLKGIDISSLPTPNIPVTPSFPPYTPNVEASPYSNRPTDYSTSSSYYQPSDSEPNRSLEADVIELEKKSVSVIADIVIKKAVPVETEQKSNTAKSVCTINERLKIFNGSIIGKKNLSLVKRPSNLSSSSESSSDSSNEEESVSSNDWVDKSNETVIFNKKVPETPKTTYSLRNRTVSCPTRKEDIEKTSKAKQANKQANKDSKANIKPVNNSNEKPPTDNSRTLLKDKQIEHKENETPNEEETRNTLTLQQIELKRQLNEKLIRFQNKIKTAEKTSSKKSTKKNTKNPKPTFMKIKLANIAKNKRKTKSDQKQNTSLQNDDTLPESSTLQIQSKSDDKRKKVASPHYIKDAEKIDKSASDIEAQNLIEGLKEREDANGENVSSSNIPANESKEENSHEISTTEFETDWRETYDTKIYEAEHECVVFTDSKKITRTFNSYNTVKILKKTFIGKVFVDGVDEEVDIPLTVSPFYTLLDIPSTKRRTSQKQNLGNQKTKSRGGNKKTDTKSVNKDSLTKSEANKSSICLQRNPLSIDVNRTFLEISKEDKEGLEAPSVKKRKLEKEDCRVPEEKDCKSLLQQINVDTFLNNIYGNS